MTALPLEKRRQMSLPFLPHIWRFVFVGNVFADTLMANFITSGGRYSPITLGKTHPKPLPWVESWQRCWWCWSASNKVLAARERVYRLWAWSTEWSSPTKVAGLNFPCCFFFSATWSSAVNPPFPPLLLSLSLLLPLPLPPSTSPSLSLSRSYMNTWMVTELLLTSTHLAAIMAHKS